MSSLNWKTAFYSGASLVCGLVKNMFETSGKKGEAINEILLYGADNEEHMREIGLNNLLCIYYVILQANMSIDVCLPSLASDTLTNCFITVQQKNKLKIRIIIHNCDNFQNLHLLAQNSIEVKIIKPAISLEHEFLLIDASDENKSAVSVMGSLDYDTKRVNCNRDATVITSEKAAVSALKREFDRIWNSGSDIAK